MFTGRFYFCDWKHRQLSFHIPDLVRGGREGWYPGVVSGYGGAGSGGTAASCPVENRKKSPGRQIFVLIIGLHRNIILARILPALPASLAFNGLWPWIDLMGCCYPIYTSTDTKINQKFISAFIELSYLSRNTKNFVLMMKNLTLTYICHV